MGHIKTTVKTETCTFSEDTIYPGRGIKFSAKDGKIHTFLNHRMKKHHTAKRRNLKLTFCQAWRRQNKKGRVIEVVKKRKVGKSKKDVKSVFGLSVEDLRKKLTK